MRSSGEARRTASRTLQGSVGSAQVRAYDDRAYCWNIGIPYKRAYALSSYALTYVALIQVWTSWHWRYSPIRGFQGLWLKYTVGAPVRKNKHTNIIKPNISSNNLKMIRRKVKTVSLKSLTHAHWTPGSPPSRSFSPTLPGFLDELHDVVELPARRPRAAGVAPADYVHLGGCTYVYIYIYMLYI